MAKKRRKVPNSKIFINEIPDTGKELDSLKKELHSYALKLIEAINDDLSDSEKDVTAQSAVIYAIANLKNRGYVGDSISLYVDAALKHPATITFNELAAVLHYIKDNRPKEDLLMLLKACEVLLTERQNKIIQIILDTSGYKDNSKKRYGPRRRGGLSYKFLGSKIGRSEALVYMEGQKIIGSLRDGYPALLEVIDEWRRRK